MCVCVYFPGSTHSIKGVSFQFVCNFELVTVSLLWIVFCLSPCVSVCLFLLALHEWCQIQYLNTLLVLMATVNQTHFISETFLFLVKRLLICPDKYSLTFWEIHISFLAEKIDNLHVYS